MVCTADLGLPLNCIISPNATPTTPRHQFWVLLVQEWCHKARTSLEGGSLFKAELAKTRFTQGHLTAERCLPCMDSQRSGRLLSGPQDAHLGTLGSLSSSCRDGFPLVMMMLL